MLQAALQEVTSKKKNLKGYMHPSHNPILCITLKETLIMHINLHIKFLVQTLLLLK